MSVCVAVAAAGAVTGAAPVLSALAASAAAALGLKALARADVEAGVRDALEARAVATDEVAIEVGLAEEAALTEVVTERATLWFGDGRITLRVSRDIRGHLTVGAKGEGVRRAELEARAHALLGLIQQQVAYRSVVSRLKSEGFSVDQEERLEDGTARVRLRLRR